MIRISPQLLLASILALSLNANAAPPADPPGGGAPNFGPALYADGGTFGTKGVTRLPAPNEDNRQSFDFLYVITNSNNPEGQLPVAEAAPGNRDYNGGRWFTHTVEWTAEAFMDHGFVPILKSQSDVLEHHSLGHLVITPGSFPMGPPVYFECPLLPVKG
jgi:hypothetical protein